MQDNKYWFFGSKLNTALLLILIVLMVFALRIMIKNKEMYFPVVSETENQTNEDWKKYPLNDMLGFHPCGTEPGATDCLSEYAYKNILGNKDDLISFSILPFSTVKGVVSYRGVIKGGYFFEANIRINVLDANKKVLKASNAVAKGEWMTSDPVNFEGNIDFTGLAKGPGYLEIHNDNASDLPENDKSILVPIVIE